MKSRGGDTQIRVVSKGAFYHIIVSHKRRGKSGPASRVGGRRVHDDADDDDDDMSMDSEHEARHKISKVVQIERQQMGQQRRS